MSSKPSKKKTPPTAKGSVAQPAPKESAAKPEVKTAAAKSLSKVPSAKAPTAKPNPKIAGRGVRYTADIKQEVIDFVAEYNAKNGRGGQSAAARKFNITILTVSSWLKGNGKPSVKLPSADKAAQGAKAAALPSQLSAQVKALLDLGEQIQKLQAQHAALSASIRSAL